MSGPDDVTKADREAWEFLGPEILHGCITGPQALARHRTEATAEKDRLLGIAVEALERVLQYRVGDLPSKGWLIDTDNSRVALSSLVAALAQIRAAQGDAS